MKMRSGPKVSGRSRRVAANQGWSLRGVPLYEIATTHCVCEGGHDTHSHSNMR